MPRIPDITPTAAPSGAPGVFESIPAGPENFGGFSARALGQVGQSFDRAGEETAQNAIRFQRQLNESATDQGNTGFASDVRPVVGAFRELRGSDAMNARADTLAKIEDIRQQHRAALANPEQQRMFDYMSRREAQRYLDVVQMHADTETKVWQGDTAKGSIQNEINESATYWNDNQRFSQALGNIKIQTSKLLALKGIDPASDAAKAEITHYTSEAWGARIRSVMAQDAGTARELFDANADQMDAAHRAQLDQQITSHQYMQMSREESQQRRRDADAQRELQFTQTSTLATMTADVLKGKSLSMGQVSELVRTQQLAPHAAEFLMSLSKRRSAGADEDNAQAVIALHRTLGDSSVNLDDKMKAITDAANTGRIKAATAGALVDRAMNVEKRGESQVAREARSSMLSAVGVPDGMVNLTHDERQRKAAAEMEWTNRVTNGNEDPITVRDELTERYAPDDRPPANWPRPRLGPVNSIKDATAVAQQTKMAFEQGRMSEPTYRTEQENLVRFKQFFEKVDARQAARAAAAPKAKASGPKAQVRGVTREGS